MTNSKPYADAFSSAFEEEKAFLDFLRERDDLGGWTKRHIRDLRIVPLDDVATPEVDPLPGYTLDDLQAILTDTMANTQLMLLDCRRAASLKAGGIGMRYTVRISNRQSYLYYEDPRWFVEGKQ